MNQRDIINSIANARTQAEQFAAVTALDLFDRQAAANHRTARQVEIADMVVGATLAPVAVHERSTIETDWLGEITASHEEVGPQVIAEAAAWFSRTSPEVRSDDEEFTEQARGMARRVASRYGEQAEGAESSFLDYVQFLHRRQAASGLPQVQQLVDAHENQAQTPLPEEVFDTFGPPVHPINQGVSGTETSERTPLIQEIEQQGGGGTTETHHDTTQSFQGPAPVEARPGVQGTTASHPRNEDVDTCPDCGEWSKGKTSCPSCGWKPGDTVGKQSSRITEPLFTPTVGLSHTATLADFAVGGRFYKEAASCGCPGVDDGDPHLADCPLKTGGERDPYDDYDDHYGAKQAASGLPQVQQIVDAKDEKPAPTPLPEEVAFPWDLEQAPEIDERSDHKANRRMEALAYLFGLTKQPVDSLTDVQRLQVAAFRKHADQWTQGDPQYHGPGAANNPTTTPSGTSGTEQSGFSQGQSDWRSDQAPTFADDSSAVPPAVSGYSEGYGDAARQDPTAPGGATPGQLPPGAGGFGDYQTHTGSLQAEAAMMTCANCGTQDKSYNMTVRGNGQSQQAWCTNCKQPQGGQSDSFTKAPATRTSSLFVTAIEQADPDFAKAYKYASTWTPGKPLVRRHADKVAFEAGLYAGISDNSENQVDWELAHRNAATRYQDDGFTQRMTLHDSMTQKVASLMPSLRTHGSYLQKKAERHCAMCDETENLYVFEKTGALSCSVHAPQVLEQITGTKKTAATSLDLDSAAPMTSPSPTGETPINGPGHTPPMDGGTDSARPGGPSPYNGAPPYGAPVVSTGPAAHGQPLAIDTQPGAPVDAAAYEHLSPQTHAFRRRVQASLLTDRTQS